MLISGINAEQDRQKQTGDSDNNMYPKTNKQSWTKQKLNKYEHE